MENLTKTQVVLLVLLVSFVVSLATGIVTVTLVNQTPPPITHTISKVVEKKSSAENVKTVVINPEEKIIKAIKNASPAVVKLIKNKNTPTGGAGFFVSKDGIILTNKHFVDDFSAEYSVITADGKTLPVNVLVRNPFQDVAVLKAQGDNFNYIPLGNSKKLSIGQSVIVMGGEFGEYQSAISVGIITRINNKITAYGSAAGSIYVAVGDMEEFGGLIQTNVAMKFTDSGGPLIDSSGAAIGVNVVSAQAGNYGFALPIEIAKKSIANILE